MRAQGRVLLPVALALFVAARWLQVTYLGWGTGFDVHLYLSYGQAWGRGEAPYVQFSPEYPPGCLPLFLFPLLVGGAADYVRTFAWEMMGFDLLAFLVVLAWARRAGPTSRWSPLLPGMLYLLATAALYPVLYTRYDLAPGALLVLALYLLYSAEPQRNASAVLLGIAAGVKLWPLALCPLWMGLAYRRKGWVGAVFAFAWVSVGVLLSALPFLPRAGTAVLSFLQYHAARGIQIESTYATFAMLLNLLHVTETHAVHEFGAFHVAGKVPAFLATASIPLLLLLVLVPQVIAFARGLGRRGDARGDVALFAAAGTVLGFMVAGKVLSPQYMMWIVPLLCLCVRGPLALAGLLLAVGLTSLVYPYWSPALEQLAPGHGRALLAVGSRNLILVIFYGSCAWRCAKPLRWQKVVT